MIVGAPTAVSQYYYTGTTTQDYDWVELRLLILLIVAVFGRPRMMKLQRVTPLDSSDRGCVWAAE